MSDKPLPYHLVVQNKLRGRMVDNTSIGSLAPFILSILTTVVVGVLSYRLTESALVALMSILVTSALLASLVYVPANGWGPGYWQIHLLNKSSRLERRQGVWWEAKPSDAAKPKRREKRMRRTIPIRIEVIEIDYEGKRYRIPLHHHIDKPYDQLYILAKGGAFASVDSFQKYRLNGELARIFDRTLSMTELRAGIGCLRVTAPLNQYATYLPYMVRNMNPIVARPEQFKLDDGLAKVVERLRSLANQLVPEMQAHYAAEDWGLLVVTIRRKEGWKKAALGKATNEQLYNLPVLQLGRSLEEDLRASTSLNLHDVHILTPEELFMLDRMSWDTTGIEDFYRQYAAIVTDYERKTAAEVAGVRQDHHTTQWVKGEQYDPDADQPDLNNNTVTNGKPDSLPERLVKEITITNQRQMFKELTETLSCWPETAIVSPSKDCIRMDNNWISVVRICSLPEQVTEDHYQSLHYISVEPGVRMRHYIGGESISGDTETLALMLKESAFTNLYDAIFEHAVVKHPGAKRQKEKLAVQSEIISANSIAQLFNEYWVVVAPSYALLKEQRNSLCADLKARQFKDVQVVDIMALQVDAFLTGALGAVRL